MGVTYKKYTKKVTRTVSLTRKPKVKAGYEKCKNCGGDGVVKKRTKTK